jgi:Uma2 family endonuclease
MVIRGAIRDYTGRRRTPADAALVIEVAEASYRTDRYTKYAIYAAARVPIYWIVDLNRNRLEVHTEPRGEGETAHYAQLRLLDPNDEVPLVLDGREVARFAVRDILP